MKDKTKTIIKECMVCGKPFTVQIRGGKILTKCFYSPDILLGDTEYWECQECNESDDTTDSS